VRITGSLPEGAYKVAAEFEDTNGVRHASGKSTVISVPPNSGILVSLPYLDDDVAKVNVYVSTAYGTVPYYVGSVAPGHLPVAILDLPDTVEPIRTQFCFIPDDISVMGSYAGYLLIGAGQWVYPSLGDNRHLFHPSDAIDFGSAVLAVEGVEAGFYVTTEDALFWVSGDKPSNWRLDQFRLPRGEYLAKGSMKVPSSILGFMESKTDVAVFASSFGVVFGSDGGSVTMPTREITRWDTRGKQASFGLATLGSNKSASVLYVGLS
jgi:hypothetical protein